LEIILQGRENLTDDFKEISRARYNKEENRWVWIREVSYEVKEDDFVGVEKPDLAKIEEQYLATREVLLIEDRSRKLRAVETGETFLPLPVHPKDVEAITFLPYYRGPLADFWFLKDKDIGEKGDREVEIGYLAIDLKPGAVVVAPFDGEMSWFVPPISRKDLLEEAYKRGYLGDRKPEDLYPGWECYVFTLRTKLPSGRILELSFYPGEAEVLLPFSTVSEDVFPMKPVLAGEPLFRYIGSAGREVSPQVTNWYQYYNRSEEGYIRRDVKSGLLVESRIGFIENPQELVGINFGKIDVLVDETGKKVFINSSK